jgi:hypothetical protein
MHPNQISITFYIRTNIKDIRSIIQYILYLSPKSISLGLTFSIIINSIPKEKRENIPKIWYFKYHIFGIQDI